MQYGINPSNRRNKTGATDGIERDSYVSPHKLSGGKRKGRSMKRYPRGNGTLPGVTLDNLKTARDNGGVYCPKLRCVIYTRTEA